MLGLMVWIWLLGGAHEAVPPGVQGEVAPRQGMDRPQAIPDGFRAEAEILLLRARALERDEARWGPALEALGARAMDRVTVGLLEALARVPEQERRDAAARALVTIAERAARTGHTVFAGEIGETLYLSGVAEDVRRRAFPLFILLNTERARRHRALGPARPGESPAFPGRRGLRGPSVNGQRDGRG